MKKISLPLISSVAALCLLFSCGKNSGDGSASQEHATKIEEEAAPPDGSNIDGLYVAKFITLNSQINGTVPGSASFLRKDDKFMAYVRLFAGYPKAWHSQYVYEGTRCPTESDDTNGDGIVDIVEAEAVLGKILIPLDSDISSQASGRRFFPLADLSGSYQYERVTSFRRFLQDLQGSATDPTGEMTKLPPGEGLRIVGKPVMIWGIGEEVQLPQTVATKGRLQTFQTIPVACGIYEKIEEIPGKAHDDEDEVPGTIAEVEEGQDRPSTEDIPETPTDPSGPERPDGDGTTNDSEDGQGPVSDGDSEHPGPRPAEETTPTPGPTPRPRPTPIPTPIPMPGPTPRPEPTEIPSTPRPRETPRPNPTPTPTPTPRPRVPEETPTPTPAPTTRPDTPVPSSDVSE